MTGTLRAAMQPSRTVLPTHSRGWRALLLAAAAIALPSAVLAASPAPYDWGPQSPDTIMRRAELARNPFLGVAVDVDLKVVSRESGRELRSSHYLLITHRADRTLLLMHTPDPSAPGALLIADDTYWLLLPKAIRPVELAMSHVVAGDLSHAGFLRVNLRIRYEPCRVDEATVDGVACWVLELAPKELPIPFDRVRYWVGKDGLMPVRIEYYGPTGALLKTARFRSYRDTGMGFAPETIEIEDSLREHETAILTLSAPTRIDTFMLRFDVGELFLLRDLARHLGAGRSLAAEPLIDALRAAANAAESAATP